MKNKNIKEVFDALNPDSEQKIRLKQALTSDGLKCHQKRFATGRRLPLVSAVALFAMLSIGVLWASFFYDQNDFAPAFAGFSITVYAEDNDKPIPVPVILKEGTRIEMLATQTRDHTPSYAFTLDMLDIYSYVHLQAKASEQTDDAAWYVEDGHDIAYLIDGVPTWGGKTVHWTPDSEITELIFTAYDENKEKRLVGKIEVTKTGDTHVAELTELISYPIYDPN